MSQILQQQVCAFAAGQVIFLKVNISWVPACQRVCDAQEEGTVLTFSLQLIFNWCEL